MLTPKLRSRPAPSWQARMMPLAAAGDDHVARGRRCARENSLRGAVRGRRRPACAPSRSTLTLRTPPIGREDLERVAQLAQRGVQELQVAGAGAVRAGACSDVSTISRTNASSRASSLALDARQQLGDDVPRRAAGPARADGRAWGTAPPSSTGAPLCRQSSAVARRDRRLLNGPPCASLSRVCVCSTCADRHGRARGKAPGRASAPTSCWSSRRAGSALRTMPPFWHGGAPAPSGASSSGSTPPGSGASSRSDRRRDARRARRRRRRRDRDELSRAAPTTLRARHPRARRRVDHAVRADAARIAAWRSSDTVAQAMGGLAYVNGHADGPPLRSLGLQAYHQAGVFASIGVVRRAARARRDRTRPARRREPAGGGHRRRSSTCPASSIRTAACRAARARSTGRATSASAAAATAGSCTARSATGRRSSSG